MTETDKSLGGTKDGSVLIKEFLGREPNNIAFLKDKGILVEDKQ